MTYTTDAFEAQATRHHTHLLQVTGVFKSKGSHLQSSTALGHTGMQLCVVSLFVSILYQ